MSKIGDKKIVRKIAWFPILIKGRIAWFRKYAKIYEFNSVDWKLIGKI